MPHESDLLAAASGNGGLVVGENTPEMNWHVYNSITPRIASTGGMLTRRNNILTGQGEVIGDPSEVVVSDIDSLHVDAAARDWRAASGSVLTNMAGFDVSALVADLSAEFTDVDLFRDSLGRAWDASDPGIGPYADSWPTS